MKPNAIFHAILAVSMPVACAARAADVSFEKDVWPILSANCHQCHSAKKQKNNLRLDGRAYVFKGGNEGPAVTARNPDKSLIIQRLTSKDADEVMPPDGKQLSSNQIAAIRAWIEQGADWPDNIGVKLADPLSWWSLKPLAKPRVPGAGKPIDVFIQAKLAEKGLTLSPEADRRTLCRRVYFDLIGLPPAPAEMDAFLADTSADAYEKLVDRVLASPRYGERWARHWLDVVHYGDTHGFDKDKPRTNAWPYRDYVIRAFNEDKPYARFVQEQIAGDALFPGTADGIEALGFIAAGPWDFIGHAEVAENKIDGKIARHLDRDDMAANTIGTFCSATIHCAQCHNHKFDPFTQEDYYSVQAVFAALDRADKTYDRDPQLAQRRAELTGREAAAKVRRDEIAARVKAAGGAELGALEKQIAEAEKGAAQGRRPEYGWHSAISSEQEKKTWVQVDLGHSVALERVVLAGAWDDFNGVGAGFGFPLRFRIEASDDPEFRGVPLVIATHDLTDYRNPGTTPQVFHAEGKSARYVRVTCTKLAPRQHDFIFALAELQVFDATGKNIALNAQVNSAEGIEAPPRWRRANLTDGIYPAATGGLDLAELRVKREALLAKAVDNETRESLQQAELDWAAARKETAKLPPAQTVYAGTVFSGSGTFAGTGSSGGKPRPIYVLARGQVTQPGAEAGPGALWALTFAPGRFQIDKAAPESARRAALAQWITDRNNPLTWRSIVNRVWQYHFGRGLVDTPNDFGRNGAPPTHPELLDWLAVEFRDNQNGSLKQLHRLIVTSAVYKQASASQAAAEKVDSENRLLWRQNRRKLEAEAVRDAVLAASGTLDLTMGGPGWQDFVIEHPEHSPHYEYGLGDPENKKAWRRSIYRFVVRSQLQPFMTSLDCADPSMRVDKRNEGLSALQALALLNDGFMLAQSRHFAERLQRESGELGAQIEQGFRLTLGRSPKPGEKEKLAEFARAYGLPNFCRVLLNLNEFIFVD